MSADLNTEQELVSGGDMPGEVLTYEADGTDVTVSSSDLLPESRPGLPYQEYIVQDGAASETLELMYDSMCTLENELVGVKDMLGIIVATIAVLIVWKIAVVLYKFLDIFF